MLVVGNVKNAKVSEHVYIQKLLMENLRDTSILKVKNVANI